MKLQVGLRMPSAEIPEGIGNEAVPRRALRETDPQRSREPTRRPPGADRCFAHFLEDPPAVLQENLPGRAQANAARQQVEQLESDLMVQALDLGGQSGL